MPGMLTAAEAFAQVKHQHDTYMGGAYVPGMSGGAYEDNLARVARANATHTAVTNANLATGLNRVGNYDLSGNLIGWTYTGGNVVTVAPNRAGVDLNPEDAQATEDLEHEVLTEDAMAADRLHSTGGTVPHPTAAYNDADDVSPYVDPMWLAEASKMTGEKFF